MPSYTPAFHFGRHIGIGSNSAESTNDGSEPLSDDTQILKAFDHPDMVLRINLSEDKWWIINIGNGQVAKYSHTDHAGLDYSTAWSRARSTDNPLTYE